jgi:hypothetical protein
MDPWPSKLTVKGTTPIELSAAATACGAVPETPAP